MLKTFEIFSSAFKEKRVLTLSPEGKEISFLFQIKDLTEEKITIPNVFPLTLAKEMSEVESFSISFREYIFNHIILEPYGINLRFNFPSEILQIEERKEQRDYLKPEEDMIVEIQHPYDKKTILRREVIDVSLQGLSFRSPTISALMQPGRIFSSVQVFRRGERVATYQGQVMYYRKMVDFKGQFYQIGLMLKEA